MCVCVCVRTGELVDAHILRSHLSSPFLAICHGDCCCDPEESERGCVCGYGGGHAGASISPYNWLDEQEKERVDQDRRKVPKERRKTIGSQRID